MCFSAQASFIAAAGLSSIGVLTIRKAGTNYKLLPLASAPLCFAAQQALEGLVWVTLNSGDSTSFLHKAAMYGFLFFAGVWWPIMVPGSLYLIEPNQVRKRRLLGMSVIGSLFAVMTLITFLHAGMTVYVTDHHLTYDFLSVQPTSILVLYYLWLGAYCIAVIGSPFLSSVPYVWIFGALVALGFITAQIFFHTAFGSVWCFFAAIISVVTYIVVKRYKQPQRSQ